MAEKAKVTQARGILYSSPFSNKRYNPFHIVPVKELPDACLERAWTGTPWVVFNVPLHGEPTEVHCPCTWGLHRSSHLIQPASHLIRQCFCEGRSLCGLIRYTNHLCWSMPEIHGIYAPKTFPSFQKALQSQNGKHCRWISFAKPSQCNFPDYFESFGNGRVQRIWKGVHLIS